MTEPKKKPKAKPRTDAEMAAFRCRLQCRMGREAIDGKIKSYVQPLEYALFLLLHAIEDLSLQIEYSQQAKQTK